MASDPIPPLPTPERGHVVVEAPGPGPGYWAGGPSIARDAEGVVWLAYRLRRPLGDGRGYANVVARSEDGESFETVLVLDRAEFACDSLERPALVARPDGGWRLYISCATPGTKHWRVDVLDADTPDAFTPASAFTVLPGDRASLAVKDPVVKVENGRWHLWLCCHPLDQPDDTDRMHTRYGSSSDGLTWAIGPPVLSGRTGTWDARGARAAEAVRRDGRWVVYYDGRATKDQNAEERMGWAIGEAPDRLDVVGGPFGSPPDDTGSLRYLTCLPLPDGGTRLYYETSRLDGAHDLRTEYVPPTR